MSLAIGPEGDYVLAVGSQPGWGMLQAVLVNWRTAGISSIIDLGQFAVNFYSVTLQGGLGLFVVPPETAVVLAFPPMAAPGRRLGLWQRLLRLLRSLVQRLLPGARHSQAQRR